ncbi:MAG TPA: spore germination protein GerW family protein [Candidatus Binatia bacterium]|nr:spore germination protein GerW family protein [Candidatus Binatia bacterium]
MQVEEILNKVRDVATVRQVFGEAYEKDGTLVVPVARVRGAGGGGSGETAETVEGSHGTGGGFALDFRPVGVYVIREGKVSWQPAVDVTRVAIGGQLVAIVALLVLRRLFRRRRGG